MKVNNGSKTLDINGFEIEYDYHTEIEDEITHNLDSSGSPETLQVYLTITGMGGILDMNDFEVRNGISNEINKISLTEFFDLNKSNIYYSGKNLETMLIEHCAESIED